jgi:hypothetical protein
LKSRGRRGGGVSDEKGGVVRKSEGEFRTLNWVDGWREGKRDWSGLRRVSDGVDFKGTSVEEERTRVRVLESEECRSVNG